MAIYEIDVTNFDKLTKLMDSLNETFDSLKHVNKEVDKIGRVNSDTKKVNKSMQEFSEHLDGINNKMMSLMGIDIAEHWNKLKEFGKPMWEAMSSGAGGFLKTVGLIFTKFNAIMLIVGAITAAVMFFKNAFKFNIGGIQSTFRKLQARFKQLMATVQMLFFNYLQKLAPIFEQIGSALEEVMNVLMSKDVLDAFMAISEVFGNLMKIVLPGLILLVKMLANWIKMLAKLINTIAGWFGIGSGGTTNNTTSNDNRTMNYYMSGQVPYGQQANDILKQLNR